MTVLEARGVTVQRAGRAIVGGVSASLETGMFVALIGANGAGKSTLLSCLAGLLKPEAGVVTLDGRPVLDIGIGIETADIARIFEPFVQADAAATRRYGGTGLGLSVSRSLAGLLGGEISVVSEPGAGARFTLRLPLDAAAA